MTPRTIAIIQARMGSSRLPGKVLLDIDGKPMLAWVVERTRKAASLDEVVVATTTDPADDPVAEICAQNGYAFSRGSLYDVLDRYIQAAREFNAEVIVRITADCPLIDPALIDQTVYALYSADTLNADFTANRLPPPWGRSYPIGLDVEVCTFAALERAWRESTEKHHREHVMPYLYDDLAKGALRRGNASERAEGSEVEKSNVEGRRSNALPEQRRSVTPSTQNVVRSTSPRGFRVALLHHTPDYGAVRWTVDTPEDLSALRALAPHLPKTGYTWQDALAIWQQHPEIAAINYDVQHKSATDTDKRATY